MQSDDRSSLAIELLISLHAHKTVGYGDAWRKRGELLSIFTNLARKYDRLVVALDQGVRSRDERLTDTAGDLCVYAGKYLTWLAEEHPEAYDNVASRVRSADCADSRGPEALARVLRALDVDARGGVDACWRRLKAAFDPLDAGLVAQAEGHAALSWQRKVELAWAIAIAAVSVVVALADDEPADWTAWRAEIERLG